MSSYMNTDKKHVLTEVEVNKRWRALWKISSFFAKCVTL